MLPGAPVLSLDADAEFPGLEQAQNGHWQTLAD
jgi:hypothetical protein